MYLVRYSDGIDKSMKHGGDMILQIFALYLESIMFD